MSKLNNDTRIKVDKIVKDQLPFYAGSYIKAQRRYMKESSLLGYAHDLATFFSYVSELISVPVKEISTDDVEAITASDIENYIEYSKHYYSKGVTRTRSGAAISRRYIILKSFYNYLYKEGLIDSLEILKVTAPNPMKKKPIIPSKEENMELIGFVSNGKLPARRAAVYQTKTRNRDKAIIVLLTCAGLKNSECRDLNINDLHLDEGYIIVKGRRYPHVTISDYVSQCISAYLEERIEMIPMYGDELALFLSIRGTRMGIRTLQCMIKKYSSTVFGDDKRIVGKDLYTSFRDQVYNMSKSLSTTAILSNCAPETAGLFYKADLNERTSDTAQV